jgi:HNH endonuclease/Homing endonuclease associated repeat
MEHFKIRLRRRDIANSEIVDDLQRVSRELHGQPVTVVSYNERGSFGSTTVLRKFGSWNAGLAAAGLPLANRINIPDDELFENLANLWTKLGRQPFGRDLAEKANESLFSLGTYEKRFGGWNKALVAFSHSINETEPRAAIESSDYVSPSDRKFNRTLRKINWRIRSRILIRDSCICQMCGASPAKNPDVQLHVDHIYPWSKGGETVVENLQTLCEKCNIGKSDVVF